MPASFYHPAGTLIFSRAPYRPDRSLTIVQPQRQSAGGVRFGFTHTIVNQIANLRLRLNTAERDQLLTFFNSTVRGQAEQFAYTDTNGQALLARFDSPTLEGLTEIAYDSHEVTVRLRIYIGAVRWQLAPGFNLLWDNGAAMTGVAL